VEGERKISQAEEVAPGQSAAQEQKSQPGSSNPSFPRIGFGLKQGRQNGLDDPSSPIQGGIDDV
jgi:hypothetical protein